jgi:hypothetical protein
MSRGSLPVGGAVGIPRWTLVVTVCRVLRSTLTASVIWSRSASVRSSTQTPDECAHLVDLCVAGSGFGLGPRFELGRGDDSFSVGEKPIEVCSEFRQVGNVGAEVTAAEAAELEGAGPAAGLNVGRLGTGAVGNSDLADPHPGSFAVQQRGDLAPDPVAGAVELVIRDSVDRGSGAGLGNP